MNRRYSLVALYASVSGAVYCDGYRGNDFVGSSAPGFVVVPRPSTSSRPGWARVTAARHVDSGHVQSVPSAYHHRCKQQCALEARKISGGAPQNKAMTTALTMLSNSGALLSVSRSTTVLSATAGPRGSKAATTIEKMDAEWAAILADEDEDEEDEEGNEEDDFNGVEEDEIERPELAVMTDVDMLETDATEGGDLEAEEEEVKPRQGRVRYASYKERIKAEKAREAARQEWLKTQPKHHVEYLEQAQRNREIASARREKYTKKFYRKKKLYDIIKERGKKAVREATWANRWPRNITRTLEELEVGEWIEGKVRNVESYGAWVDVNAERDGLLHVKDMSETFTPIAEQVVVTRDIVRVRVKFVNPGAGKLGLSLVEDGPREDDLPLPPPRPAISVADITPGAELWGYVERVTNMGAYVNVGAERPGFLLLKEIPGRPKGLDAPQVLKRNKRLRVYAKEVDPERLRIKLTCKRPRSRPRCGPPSALASDSYSEEFEYDDRRGRYQEDGDVGEGGLGLDHEAEGGEDWWNDDEEDDSNGGDWFLSERGEVIPAPEEDLV